MVCHEQQLFIIPKHWRASKSAVRWPNDISNTAAEKLVKKSASIQNDWDTLDNVRFLFFCGEFYNNF